ncbi:NAD(P)H:quinone oxidoreductase [Brumicola pallidula]|uniref:Trp repressor binding protein n=1 Tax=Brumicola pallidula DSM 14239 = ACAM 615 TaxID=1121922 RepID=K6ZG85_9ALTE|nr:NAD(P)H:quinone oxidoreductase [Glaciecola pallidula]GAC29352.1 Trp repressor binding protein [Glaciecola pallidula DSM 14239 = ACAM 615]
MNSALCQVLVLYYSKHGLTKKLADSIVKGIESEGVEALLRTVPDVSNNIDTTVSAVPASGAPYVTLHDLANCDGLALGSPTHFGNMSGAMKFFWDTTSGLWLKGSLIDKPACTFTSSSSLHGGQETTLISMMMPLIHHGMVYIGVPYSVGELHKTTSGGTPYGASAVALPNKTKLSHEEQEIAIAQGKRLATIAKKLKMNSGI